jgi:hypothetical protein
MFLVIFLGAIELARGGDFRGDGALEKLVAALATVGGR